MCQGIKPLKFISQGPMGYVGASGREPISRTIVGLPSVRSYGIHLLAMGTRNTEDIFQ